MAYDDEEQKKKKPVAPPVQVRSPIARDPNTSSSLGRGVQSVVGGNPAVANIVANAQNRAPLLGAGSLAATAAPAAPAPQPTVGVGPMRANIAPPAAPPQPNPAAAYGAAPYVAQARQMTTGLNPAVMGQNAPQPAFQMQGQVPMGVTQNEMGQANQQLNRLPAVQAAQGTMASSQIAQNVGSGFTNQQVADMSARTQLVAQNPNIPIEQALRNQATQASLQQRANGPLARSRAGDQAYLEKTRAAAMPTEKAVAELAKTNNQGYKKTDGAGNPTERWADAKTRGEAFKKKNDEADAKRRSEPLAMTNINNAQERKAQLEYKRERRETMGAANSLQRQAMGQGDPQVKAQMAKQAADLAKGVNAIPKPKRTTFGDEVARQDAVRQEDARINAGAGGNYATPRGQRDLAEADKARAEIQAIRDRMPEQDKLKLASLDKQIEKMLPTDPGYAEVVRQRDAMFDSARKPGGGQGGQNSQAAPATIADQASFDKLPSGSWFINPKDGKVLQKK